MQTFVPRLRPAEYATAIAYPKHSRNERNIFATAMLASLPVLFTALVSLFLLRPGFLDGNPARHMRLVLWLSYEENPLCIKYR